MYVLLYCTSCIAIHMTCGMEWNQTRARVGLYVRSLSGVTWMGSVSCRVLQCACLPDSMLVLLGLALNHHCSAGPASWWYSSSMLSLHHRQDGNLQICKQDIVVEIADGLGFDVPREKADRLFIHVQISRARARLVILHEPFRLIDVPID